MDEKVQTRGKAAVEWLQEDVAGAEGRQVSVDVSALKALVEYAKALEAGRAKITKDVYIRGEYWTTILKADLSADEVALLEELGRRSEQKEATVEVEDHNPLYPLPNWRGHVRVE